MDMDGIKKWVVDHDWLILNEVRSTEVKAPGIVSLTAVSPGGTVRTFKENPKGGIIVG